MTKEEIRHERKLAYEAQKALQSKREQVYKDTIAYQKSRSKEEKICLTDSAISLQKLNKIYPNRVQAVFDFDLEIKEKEFIVLVGPSGCGKSTTLRMIAGLEDITSGDLFIDKEYANDLEPKDRDVAMVFQSYALYPHMTVYDNLAFGLEVRKIPRDEIEKRVKETAKILEIEKFLDRKPKALSGGQKQRVALGRAIVRNSRIFLMDEPLSNLDAKLRIQMRSEIVNLHNRLGTTTVYVTHDQTEAMTMATRIVVMKDGYVQQVGTPRQIYNTPANVFVATFIGSPAMNIVSAVYDEKKLAFSDGYVIPLSKEMIKKHDDFYKNAIDDAKTKITKLEAELVKLNNPEDKKPNHYLISYNQNQIDQLKTNLATFESIVASKIHNVKFGIRPEDIIQEGYVLKEKALTTFKKSQILVAELLGNEYYVHFLLGDQKVIAKVNAGQELNVDDHINIALNLENVHIFDETTENYIF